MPMGTVHYDSDCLYAALLIITAVALLFDGVQLYYCAHAISGNSHTVQCPAQANFGISWRRSPDRARYRQK